MNKLVLCAMVLLFVQVGFAQNHQLNQIVVLNSGTFGNPNENVTVALVDPIKKDTFIIDTIVADGAQYVLVDGKEAYVLATSEIVKYNLDTREKIAVGSFAGFSAHRVVKYEDKIYVSEFFSGSNTNLCVYDADSLKLIRCIDEISTNPKGLAVIGDTLYVSQNLSDSKDVCPPFGCYGDTAGYVAVVDLITDTWVRDISLNNGGNNLGRMFVDGNKWYALNQISNTITSYDVTTGLDKTDTLSETVNITDYGTSAEIIDGYIYGDFGRGIGRLQLSTYLVEDLIDTNFVGMSLDTTKNEFYLTFADFRGLNYGLRYSFDGELLDSFFVGVNPENMAIQYNSKPEFTDYINPQFSSRMAISLSSIAVDPDNDKIESTNVVVNPLAGSLELKMDSVIFSPILDGPTIDSFVIELCDIKQSPFCQEVKFIIGEKAMDVGIVKNSLLVSAIYPNPAQDILKVQLKKSGTVSVLDNTGKVVFADDSQSKIAHEINISNLNTGIYMLYIQSGKDATASFFVKE